MTASTPIDADPAAAEAFPPDGRSRRVVVVAAVLAVVLATLALRTLTLVAALADGTLGLHVDEAQYWVWSRELAWGYASKPPLIAALIALATRLGGDAVLVVRSVGLLLYPLTAGVLAILAWQLASAPADRRRPAPDREPARAGRAGRAAIWAALLFAASPLAGLLGLVSTTDAPLLLAWSGACALLWQALHSRRRGLALLCWCGLGVVAGLGLLAKYSFAAWLPGAAWAILLARHDPARRHDAAGLVLAAALLLLVVAPHLGWNAAEGWPALRHTLQITLQDGASEAGADAVGGAGTGAPTQPLPAVLVAIGRVLGVPLSLALLLGPLWVAWLPLLWPRLRRGVDRPALHFVLALHAPLLAIGLLQAGLSAPQMNWLAPVVPGLVLLLALALAERHHGARSGLVAGNPAPTLPDPRWLMPAVLTLALHASLVLALPLAAPLAQAAQAWWSDRPPVALPRSLDLWARMRGWPAAFADLREPLLTQLARQPGVDVVTASRSVAAQGRHAWRDLPVAWRAWKPPGPPTHHFQRAAPWPAADDAPRPGGRSAPVLLLLDQPPPAALQARLYGLVCLTESAHAPRLSLWRAWPVAAIDVIDVIDAAGATPTVDHRHRAAADDCPPRPQP